MKIFEVTKNRGNIRFLPKPNQYLGTIGEHKGFAMFENQTLGDRALIKLLLSYHSKGFNNISKIINRYAPPIENKTSDYVNFVSDSTKINKDSILNFNNIDQLFIIFKAIIKKETGINASLTEFNDAFNLLKTTELKKKVTKV